MIRDEFKGQDKKTISKKANKKLQQMGERAYYSKKLSFLNDLFKPVKISTIFSLVCFMIPALFYLIVVLIDHTYKMQVAGYVVISLAGLLLVWTIVWFAILVPYFKKKVEFYRQEIARLNREYILKSNGMNKN